jgi:hypothetical protein
MSQTTLGAIGLAVAATCCASLVAAKEKQNNDPEHSILPLSPRKDQPSSNNNIPRSGSRIRAQSPTRGSKQQEVLTYTPTAATAAATEVQEQQAQPGVEVDQGKDSFSHRA